MTSVAAAASLEAVLRPVVRSLRAAVKAGRPAPSLRDLAAVAGVSQRTLQRTVREVFGKPVRALVDQFRLERALLLVQTTGMPLAAVAAAVGLGSQSRLNELFRRHLRGSPGDFRGAPPASPARPRRRPATRRKRRLASASASAGPRHAARRAVSLVELLVVIAVIAALVALLLPAVQAMRESARRVQCGNNMRQTCLAVVTYERLNGVLPPGYARTPAAHSLYTFLLPHLEQQAVHDRVDWKVAWNAGANASALAVNLPMATCPSAPAGRPFAADYAPCELIASSAYGPLVSAGTIASRSRWTGALGNGPRRADDVADGLSATWMLFEDAGRPLGWADGRATASTTVSGSRWADVESYFHVHDQRAGRMQNITNDNEIYAFHPGGAMFGFGDGAVRFGSDSIDPDVFVARFTGNALDLIRGDR